MANNRKRGPMGPGAIGAVEKAQDFKGTTKKLIKDYLSQYKILIIIVIIFAIGSTVFSILGPKILGNATTEIFNGLVSKLSGGERNKLFKNSNNSFNPIRPIFSKCSIFINTGIYNDKCCTKTNL